MLGPGQVLREDRSVLPKTYPRTHGYSELAVSEWDPDPLPHGADAIGSCGVNPDHPPLEVTESVMSTDPEAAGAVLEAWHSRGVVRRSTTWELGTPPSPH